MSFLAVQQLLLLPSNARIWGEGGGGVHLPGYGPGEM